MFKSNNGLLSKFYNLNPVELPSQSFGSCFNNRKCGNINVDLADGFCVKCWDVGKNKKYNTEVHLSNSNSKVLDD